MMGRLKSDQGQLFYEFRLGDAVPQIIWKNVMLVAPDVDVDVFRTQIARMGPNRPRIALFVSQDDSALALSQTIWGGTPRLGEVNPAVEPYRTEFERDQILVFDLTKLKTTGDNAHSRAFDDITTVVSMIHERLGEEQTKTARGQSQGAQIEQASLLTGRNQGAARQPVR